MLHGVYKKAIASAHSRTRSTPEESLAQPTMLLAFCALTMHLSEPASKNSAEGFSAIHLNNMLMSAFLRQYATNELICNGYVLYNTEWPDSTNDSII